MPLVSPTPGAPPPLGRLARWSVPTIGNASVLAVIVLMVANPWRFLLDSGTGWQIRTGDWILSNFRVPRAGDGGRSGDSRPRSGVPGRPGSAAPTITTAICASPRRCR